MQLTPPKGHRWYQSELIGMVGWLMAGFALLAAGAFGVISQLAQMASDLLR